MDIENKNNILFNLDKIANQEINVNAHKIFLKHKLIPKEYIENEKDQILGLISYIYDYNYKLGLEIIKENNYIEKLINTININNDTKINEIKQIAIEYLNYEIKNREK